MPAGVFVLLETFQILVLFQSYPFKSVSQGVGGPDLHVPEPAPDLLRLPAPGGAMPRVQGKLPRPAPQAPLRREGRGGAGRAHQGEG